MKPENVHADKIRRSHQPRSNPINKAKNQIPARAARATAKTQADRMKKIHSEYLEIMQKYYAGQYEKVANKFFAKFPEDGDRARKFKRERNMLFQGGEYANLSGLLNTRDLSEDELYSLTEKHQQGMKETLKNLESML
ncbi:hypothetical protein HA402_015024 [Bradysia odoriphaga]|nr:hypothetical protein HA402_015024 [Bradysia odoriphaga]